LDEHWLALALSAVVLLALVLAVLYVRHLRPSEETDTVCRRRRRAGSCAPPGDPRGDLLGDPRGSPGAARAAAERTEQELALAERRRARQEGAQEGAEGAAPAGSTLAAPKAGAARVAASAPEPRRAGQPSDPEGRPQAPAAPAQAPAGRPSSPGPGALPAPAGPAAGDDLGGVQVETVDSEGLSAEDEQELDQVIGELIDPPAQR
ncbi:MAG TPA: hypothetical protein VNI01_08975, partial [Elusimicrobiota bacterium]|nr:hypothetical protein [Elusimicrobiota bacterium]